MLSKSAKKAIRRIYELTTFRPDDYLAERVSLVSQVRESAENGLVALVSGGMDCDGSQWSGRVSVVPAIPYSVRREIESMYDWADGPISVRIEKPSVAALIESTSRDLAMEAFENGHPHVLYP